MLFYGGFWLFLKKETFFLLNRIYLVTSLLLAFIIPAIPVPSPWFTVETGGVIGSPVSSQASPDRAAEILRGLVTVGDGRIGTIAAVVYFAGVLVFLGRFLLHLAKLHGVIRRHGVRIDRGSPLVSVEEEFPPFSFLHFIFLNDRHLSPDEIERILAHERVHIRQRHSLDILLMELVMILQWFNPCVWPYKKSLQETHEFLADEGVIAQGFSVAMYRRLVFEQHAGARLLELVNNFKQSQIKRRLTMMSKTKSGSAARLKLLLALPLAVFLVLAFADPRPIDRAGGPTGVVPQESAVQEHAAQAEKDKAAQLELKALKDRELTLREKLEAAPTPEVRQDLKKELEIVLKKQQELQAKAIQQPAPGRSDLAAEYKMLQEKETAIRVKIKEATDAAAKAELEAVLAKVLAMEAKIKAEEAAAASDQDQALAKLKQAIAQLEQKKQEVRSLLDKTDDPQKKAELEDTLKKIEQKQEQIRTEAAAVKAKAEASPRAPGS
jgi:hypothetical protein